MGLSIHNTIKAYTKMKRYVIIIGLMLTFILGILSTTYSQDATKWIQPTPNSYSFAKYGEIPVPLYTGVPDISIPLASLKANDVETQVSISYHGSGIKVDDIASWVGLGWNLNLLK